MNHIRRLVGKKQSSSASAERLKREQENYIKHGSGVLEELLALCDGNCRIPLRYFSAIEIERATQPSDKKIDVGVSNITVGLLNKRFVLIRFWKSGYTYPGNIYRDIAISAQMSHLKNVLRLVGCCLEFERPVMVYEYVEAITLDELLFYRYKYNQGQTRKSLLSWGSRLRIANDVASAVVFLHTEFTTPIIYRDLNPYIVIIDQTNGVAKIVDFSLSISLPPGESQVEDRVCGTIGYLDPEYAHSDIITQKTDVFSFGVVLFQLLTGKKVTLVDGTVIDRQHFDNVSYIEGNNIMDLVEHGIGINIEGNNIMDLVDPAILEEHGIGIEQQLEDYLDLCKKCTASKGEDRYMIEVAKELRRIEKCFRVLTLGQN